VERAKKQILKSSIINRHRKSISVFFKEVYLPIQNKKELLIFMFVQDSDATFFKSDF